MSGAPKQPRGGKRDNRKVRPDDGRRANGGAQRGAGRTAYLPAHLRRVRRMLATHGHKFTPIVLDEITTELDALAAEVAALRTVAASAAILGLP